MKHYQYWSQLSDDSQKKIKEGLLERGLTRWEFLDLQKDEEDIKIYDLENWKSLCEDRNIDPATIIVDDNNLNYKWVADNYEFKTCYFPNELEKIASNDMVPPCSDKIPSVNLNFMAGNYHANRYKLLERMWENNLLTDESKLLWSSYRDHMSVPDGGHQGKMVSTEFLEFMAKNTPRTFMGDKFYNKYPEEIDLGTHEQVYVNDYNKQDAWIYENSLVSVVLDTMSSWPNNDEIPQELLLSKYTTPKTFKAIKHKRPFILTIGKSGNDLPFLRNLGFETFASVWDESYDTQSYHKRLDQIGNLCYNLSNENITELYHATRDICEHNYNVLVNTDWADWYLMELDKQYD
jgi:hypothetical protein